MKTTWVCMVYKLLYIVLNEENSRTKDTLNEGSFKSFKINYYL